MEAVLEILQFTHPTLFSEHIAAIQLKEWGVQSQGIRAAGSGEMFYVGMKEARLASANLIAVSSHAL